MDDITFRRLLELTDPVGVLTVTTGFVPGTTDDQTVRIDLHNRLKSTLADLERAGDVDRLRALEKVVASLGDDLDGVLDSRQPGRGRALVVTLSDGVRHHVNVQVPFEDRVVVADRAFVRPLVAAIDEGRPAGIVVATRSGVRVLEWSLAGTRELARLDFELTDAQLADSHGGPVAANPARGTTSASHREAFEDRVEDNRHRFLKEAAATVAALTAERRWDRLVVAGGEKIRAELASLLSDHRAEVVSAPDAAWETLTPGRIAQEAWPLLRSLHRAREADLWRRAQEAAGARGAAALGARRVCEAANVGRIDHLLFARDAEVEGHVAEDGSLHESVGGPAAQAGLAMTRDPHLVERLVERVLAMGGEVTRVDGDEITAAMATHQGLAALLRW